MCIRDRLGSYFKSLLNSPSIQQVNPIPGFETDAALDDPIDEEEVRTTIRALKNNKAPGLDGLPASTFKMFHSHLISFTTALFNKLLEQEVFPEAWSTGLIKPLYKKGDKKIPSNYRGITLLPLMSKIFTAIIRDRLLYWADLNDKLNESQFGFRQGRRTTDAIFIMSTAIQAYKKKKSPLYACFVDYAKAFDSDNHNLLCKTCIHGPEHKNAQYSTKQSYFHSLCK